MKQSLVLRIQLMLICTISFSFLNAQSNSKSNFVKLYGQVKDEYTGAGIAGVNVRINSLQKGAVTDEEGNYTLLVPKGTFTVQFSRVDLSEVVQSIDIIKDTKYDLEMKEKVFTLEEVSVFSEGADANVKNLSMGRNTIPIEKLNALPTFLGETDVVRGLTLLPGVSTVGEGASGFNVRGGGVDQNLILQDGGMIFNSSHVFGFFSTFNPAVVDKATLYKSGLPAKYGGRLSSVLDVGLKEGDFKKYSVSGGLGLVSSKLAIEGPVLKDKLSFMVGTRLSYSDWLLRLAEDPSLKKSTAAFQDVNAKLTYFVNQNNKIAYSGYISNDKFGLASDTTFGWRTTNHNFRWNHTFNEKLILNADFTLGQYTYKIEDENGINSFQIESNINFTNTRLDLVYDITEKNQLNFGGEAIFYEFKPGLQEPLTDDSGVKWIQLENEKSREFGLYAEDEYEFSSKFSVRGGVRFSYFSNIGAGSDYIYSEGPRQTENIIDTVYYDSGEPIANYNGIEPRVNINYNINSKSSIKASYNRTRQYLHLITNTAAVTPTDLWKTSNRYIQPETGDQISIGYFRNFSNNTIETSVETYYKEADNIVDFKDGTKLLMNENIEADLINGTSQAYGIEFFVNKKSGKLTGWMSYTFSRIFRTVNGTYESEKINLGERYPANNDKPHNVSIAAMYKTSPIVEFGANFTYSTGRPNTEPLSLYNVSNQSSIFNFSQRNQGRIPDYHRLDLSMTIDSKPKVDRKWKMSWTLAVYNVYARKNAFSVFYENQYGSPPKAYKLSVLGSAFPSIMLNFKF